jgi:hypothetical protein
MKRSITVGLAVLACLVCTSAGVAAQRYLITASSQIKPGAIAYRNLDRHTRRLIAHTGKRGPRGFRGPSAPNALAEASGLVAWTADPALLSAGVADSSGSIHGGSVWLNQGQKITWLAEFVLTHGGGMTHAAYAIYDERLHLVARTADRPSAFQTTANNQWVKLSLSSPFKVPASGRYYLVDLLAASAPPRVGIVGDWTPLTEASVLPGGVPRSIRGGSGLSDFPATLTNTRTAETRCMLAG